MVWWDDVGVGSLRTDSSASQACGRETASLEVFQSLSILPLELTWLSDHDQEILNPPPPKKTHSPESNISPTNAVFWSVSVSLLLNEAEMNLPSPPL